MLPTTPEQIIPELRDAVGPVILISGVGLLLLTMTNRLGRTIDRARQLKHELAPLAGQEREQVQAQVDIIFRRAKIIRLAIVVLIAVLYFTGNLSGLFAIILGILAVAFVITSLISFCPLYLLFK